MNQRLISRLSVLLTASWLILCASAGAGVTGKISGLVKDAQSGHPLIGATVRVVGTDLIAQTDEDGEYFIIGVPGGKYDISVTHVGFENIIRKDVRVLLDLTTPVDFTLPQMAVEIKNQVVVYATAPKVQKDLTSSRVIFTADQLKNLPNQQSVQAVLRSYPGVVIDRNSNMHVRGGRSGQVSYYYNGFNIQDPFYSVQGMRIVPGALEELSLTSGGFTAEYGEAQSGIVNAVTSEGGQRYRGKLRAYEGFTHKYDVGTGQWGDLSRNGNRSLSGNLSGPLPFADPKRYNFSGSGEYVRDNGSLPHNYYISYNGEGKITMRPVARMKMLANFAYWKTYGDSYVHRDVNGISYDFNLSGLPSYRNSAYLAGVSANYTLGDRSMLSFSLNRFQTQAKSAPKRYFDLYWNQWPGYSEDSTGRYNGTIQVDNYLHNIDWTDPYQATGFTKGSDYQPTYAWRKASYNALSASWLSQITKNNEVKVGFNYSRYNVDWDFKQFYNSNPYGEKYSRKPVYSSVFAQDKLEYRDVIMNLGLRYDYRNSEVTYKVWEMVGTTLTPRFQNSTAKSSVSPRLGMSFPITENSVIRFNYGVYYETPRYDYLYSATNGDISTGRPLLGNPDLRSEETKSYELGLTHMIREGLRMNITAYYKDMTDLVSTRSIAMVAGQAVTQYTNSDYGSSKGFDVIMELLPGSHYLSGSVAYSYLIANGIGSYASEPYYTYLASTEDTLAPRTQYPLDFDQRHTLTAALELRMPVDWKGSLFGMKVPGGWGLGMVGYLGSGMPYTKTDALGNRLGERNAGRLPSSAQVDMKFNKDFAIGLKNTTVTWFVEVDNLFNKRNILNVYKHTGLPDNDNRIIGASGLSTSLQELQRLDHLYDHDPQNYSNPRTVRTGLEVSF